MGLFDALKKHDRQGFLKIDVKPLIDWDEPNGEGCLATDMITKKGWKVGYMYREEPLETMPDSGWRFFQGDESDEYVNNPDNSHVFALNTICNYDRDIIPYLKSPVGTRLVRTDNGKFTADEGQAIVLEKQ